MSLAYSLGKLLLEKNFKISTVESCTGGLLSSKLTDVSGSSSYITLNLVTYSNEAKHRMLGVEKDVLNTVGAVSEECAKQMAEGLFRLTNSDICVSTTGIAGPTGGTKDKPVGLMYSAIHTAKGTRVYKINLNPDLPREQMKNDFAEEVLKNIIELIKNM